MLYSLSLFLLFIMVGKELFKTRGEIYILIIIYCLASVLVLARWSVPFYLNSANTVTQILLYWNGNIASPCQYCLIIPNAFFSFLFRENSRHFSKEKEKYFPPRVISIITEVRDVPWKSVHCYETGWFIHRHIHYRLYIDQQLINLFIFIGSKYDNWRYRPANIF